MPKWPPKLELSKRGIRYGAFPSRIDHRDYGLPTAILRTAPAALRSRISLSLGLGPVKNQGQQGSCTAHGGTSEGERLYRRWKDQAPIFSPAFHYYQERKREGTLADGDCGAQVVSSLIVADPRAAGGIGFCPEELMPYSDADSSTAPSAAALEQAAQWPGGAYHSIGGNILDMKACIDSDYSFVIGIAVYESFESEETANSGLIPFPSGTEALLGYHEVHAGMVADDSIQCPGGARPGAIMIQNSWGTEWGIECPIAAERGFAWLPYDYLANPALTTDVRMSHLGRAW